MTVSSDFRLAHMPPCLLLLHCRRRPLSTVFIMILIPPRSSLLCLYLVQRLDKEPSICGKRKKCILIMAAKRRRRRRKEEPSKFFLAHLLLLLLLPFFREPTLKRSRAVGAVRRQHRMKNRRFWRKQRGTGKRKEKGGHKKRLRLSLFQLEPSVPL